jgi:hypothetical protein
MTEKTATPPFPGKVRFSGKIYVITDHRVFSSGETFVEQLKAMPNVTQVGVATDASTYYSDVRFDVSPVGLPFMFPTKGFTDPNYKRGSGEGLKPEIPILQDPNLEISGKDSMRIALEKLIMDKHRPKRRK